MPARRVSAHLRVIFLNVDQCSGFRKAVKWINRTPGSTEEMSLATVPERAGRSFAYERSMRHRNPVDALYAIEIDLH
jgi:hypothetical protein